MFCVATCNQSGTQTGRGRQIAHASCQEQLNDVIAELTAELFLGLSLVMQIEPSGRFAVILPNKEQLFDSFIDPGIVITIQSIGESIFDYPGKTVHFTGEIPLRQI